MTFRLPVEQLAHWSVATSAFTVDPGGYEIVVARSADHPVLSAPLTVTGTAPVPRDVVERRTLAVDFDDYADATRADATRADGDAVTPTDPARPATLLFRDTDLSGAVRIEAETAREGAGPGEARLVLGTADQVPAELDVPVTGDRYAWTTTAPALFSVALMDPICPPSTVYAAFNHYRGQDRTMTVWPFGDHGGGLGSNPPVQLSWLRERGLAPEF